MADDLVVESPRVVGDERQPALVADLGQRADVGRGAVVARRGDHRRARLGMSVEDSREVLGSRVERELELLVEGGLDVDRPRPREHEPGEGRLVPVARHHERLTRAGHRHHRDVDVHRRPVGREHRLLGADRLGEELLGA